MSAVPDDLDIPRLPSQFDFSFCPPSRGEREPPPLRLCGVRCRPGPAQPRRLQSTPHNQLGRITPEETRAEKEQRRKATPIEEKESQRWIDTLRQANDVAGQVPAVKCVCIADSEADIYELFMEPRGEVPVDWVVRACQDRALVKDAENGDDAARRIRAAVESQQVLFTKELSVRGRGKTKVSCEKRARRQPRKSRTTHVEVRAATVTLRGPERPGGRLPSVTLNVVQVREINPPTDDVAVEWLLITTLPIENAEQVREVIQYYTVRFMIEVFFHVLKSGCRVEERRFEHIDRMLPCVAAYQFRVRRRYFFQRQAPRLRRLGRPGARHRPRHRAGALVVDAGAVASPSAPRKRCTVRSLGRPGRFGRSAMSAPNGARFESPGRVSLGFRQKNR